MMTLIKNAEIKIREINQLIKLNDGINFSKKHIAKTNYDEKLIEKWRIEKSFLIDFMHSNGFGYCNKTETFFMDENI